MDEITKIKVDSEPESSYKLYPVNEEFSKRTNNTGGSSVVDPALESAKESGGIGWFGKNEQGESITHKIDPNFLPYYQSNDLKIFAFSVTSDNGSVSVIKQNGEKFIDAQYCIDTCQPAIFVVGYTSIRTEGTYYYLIPVEVCSNNGEVIINCFQDDGNNTAKKIGAIHWNSSGYSWEAAS